MSTNKQIAAELYMELQNAMKLVETQIESAEEDGPVLQIIVNGLTKALDALRTRIYSPSRMRQLNLAV